MSSNEGYFAIKFDNGPEVADSRYDVEVMMEWGDTDRRCIGIERIDKWLVLTTNSIDEFWW